MDFGFASHWLNKINAYPFHDISNRRTILSVVSVDIIYYVTNALQKLAKRHRNVRTKTETEDDPFTSHD